MLPEIPTRGLGGPFGGDFVEIRPADLLRWTAQQNGGASRKQARIFPHPSAAELNF